MQCDICSRSGGPKLPLLCPTDVRNYLYGPRIEHATILVEKNFLDQQVTAVLSKGRKISELTPATTFLDVAALKAEKDQILDRTQFIIAKADELRSKVEQARQELVRRKAVISRRKSDLVSASSGIDARRSKLIYEVERSIQMIRTKWHQKHVATMSARSFLCSEAARLYGLKKVRNKNSKDEYRLGRTLIVDLEKLHTINSAQISTVLSHIVHLLLLSAHYLGLHLPAEITLPHQDYPLPTIFPIQSSYKYSNVPFPGSSPQTNLNVSRRVEKPHQPRPRPLYIHKPLPTVAIENSSEYTHFLEGVALLAYDIAWVCKSQGITIGEDDNFHNICDIGRNLFNLLIGIRPRLSLEPRRSSSEGSIIPNYSDIDNRVSFSSSLLGKYSHNTAHSFLGRAEGTYLTSSWKLPSPIEITDRLRSQLMSEAANAEWELLNADAWSGNQEGEISDAGIVTQQQKRVSRSRGLGMQNFLNIKNAIDAVEVFTADGERKVKSSGWTKLKPR